MKEINAPIPAVGHLSRLVSWSDLYRRAMRALAVPDLSAYHVRSINKLVRIMDRNIAHNDIIGRLIQPLTDFQVYVLHYMTEEALHRAASPPPTDPRCIVIDDCGYLMHNPDDRPWQPNEDVCDGMYGRLQRMYLDDGRNDPELRDQAVEMTRALLQQQQLIEVVDYLQDTLKMSTRELDFRANFKGGLVRAVDMKRITRADTAARILRVIPARWQIESVRPRTLLGECPCDVYIRDGNMLATTRVVRSSDLKVDMFSPQFVIPLANSARFADEDGRVIYDNRSHSLRTDLYAQVQCWHAP